MYRLVCSNILLLAFFILSNARHTVFVSHDGVKIYLPGTSQSDVCLTPTCVIAAADVLTSLDEKVDPCDDFYSFACGGWMKRQEVSDDQPLITLFLSTQKDVNRKLKDLLESEYQSLEPPFVKMLKDFYKTCADEDTLENEGSKPLKTLLRHLGGWPVVDGRQWDDSTFDWLDTLISFRKLGIDHEILLNLYVDDFPPYQTFAMLRLGDPSTRRLHRANLTLGLEDPQIAEYYEMMLKAAKLLGADESTAEKEMLEAIRFEIVFAEIISKLEEDHSEEKRRHEVYTIAELQKELPQVPWLKLINGLLLVDQVSENETIINGYPDFLTKFADLITSTDKRVIANYMLWKAVLQCKDFLSEEWKNIEEKKEEIMPSKLMGKSEIPRWEDCLSLVKYRMETGLDSYFIRKYFSRESKNEAVEMMKYIHKEFLKILKSNDWMDEKTREKAEEKANAIKAYIGYPDELLNDTFVMKTYENLTITTNTFLENMLTFNKWIKNGTFLKLGVNSDEILKKRRRSMYYFSLLVVNAFFISVDNRIEIPAGILRGGFFDKDRPNYMNFAEIGYLMGHEITHGFDNDGRKYDKDGNFVNWWDKESDEHFRKKVKCIIDQYNNYTMGNGIKLNGEKTQNEDIADNGGLKEAYLAYQSWTKDHGTEPLLPGVNYSQNQIFWLSAAHVWCAKYQPETLKELMLLDVHSPAKFRIIGPMSNLPEFSKDFNCSPDSPMNRKYKCEVW